ncbi:MAG: NmrA family NAD(P)-binding protein [Anaerolineales bacterium]|nr:NmrA family NAD(P)-binding protein [Anaerolineales bacterium]
MILVIGAAGKTGQRVVAALAGQGMLVRAQVRRREQVDLLRRLGAQEVVAGEFADPAMLANACTGANAIYLIAPNMYREEASLAAAVLEVARAAGVARIVYHSVLHPQTEEMPHHWSKVGVEAMLFRSGLPFTILQPAAYMQNLVPQLRNAAETGFYRVPYATATRLGMVDLEDVAEVAAKVLTQDGHEGATYELAGTEVLTQDQVAATMSAALGRRVSAEVQDRVDWAAHAHRAGLGEYAVATLVRMFEYYERYGFWGNSFVLSCLLGRRPSSLGEVLERETR